MNAQLTKQIEAAATPSCEIAENVLAPGGLTLQKYLIAVAQAMIRRGESTRAVESWIDAFLSDYYAEV